MILTSQCAIDKMAFRAMAGEDNNLVGLLSFL